MKRYGRLARNLFIVIVLLLLFTIPSRKRNLGQTLDSTLLLVNFENQIPMDYIPSDLVVPNIKFTFDEDHPKKQMRKEAAQAIEKMFNEASNEGLNLLGISGYRSAVRQQEIFRNRVDEVGEKKAREYVALPGESEHQTGLAMDVGSLDGSFGESKEGKWVRDNAHNFGFIIRYPEGKEHITGINYEPWHIRYVGIEHATNIHSENITLEEYLEDKVVTRDEKDSINPIGNIDLVDIKTILNKLRPANILETIKAIF